MCDPKISQNSPTMLPQNLPGASSMQAANHIFPWPRKTVPLLAL